MSIKVAIASSDSLNIDLHFGQTSQFHIYELRGDHFEFLETRDVPKAAQKPRLHKTSSVAVVEPALAAEAEAAAAVQVVAVEAEHQVHSHLL